MQDTSTATVITRPAAASANLGHCRLWATVLDAVRTGIAEWRPTVPLPAAPYPLQTSNPPLVYVPPYTHTPTELLSVALLLLGEVVCCAAHELHTLQQAQPTGASITTRTLEHHSWTRFKL